MKVAHNQRPQLVQWLRTGAALALVLLAIITAFGAATRSARADVPPNIWGQLCFPPYADDSGMETRSRCIAGAQLNTRGYFANRACLELPPLPGAIYPTSSFCGGRGGGGGEALEQARAIAELGANGLGGGVNPNVQWEVNLYQNSPPAGEDEGNRFADLLYYDHQGTNPPVQAYELKGTWNNDFNARQTQLQQYIDLLNFVVPGHAVRGTELLPWQDLFMVNTGIPCGPNNAQRLLDVYIGWSEPPSGIFDIYRYRPNCFDPQEEPVPRPVDVPAWVPLPVDLPDSLFEHPKPFAGTPWPKDLPPLSPPQQVPPPQPFPWPRPSPPFTPPGGQPLDPPPDWTCLLNPVCLIHNWDPHWPDWHWPDWPPQGGGQFGDPHILTVDGLNYHLQAAGEFETALADQYGLEIQSRFTPEGDSWSTLRSLAFTLDGHVVEVRYQGAIQNHFYIDHAPYDLSVGSMLDFGDGAMLIHKDDGYYAAWPGEGSRPALWATNTQFRLYVPPGTDLRGLLGNNDGDPSNDLTSGFGTVLPSSASPATIHGTFADSWRVTPENSLFTYDQNDSTDTYTDRTFPPTLLTIADLADSALADGTSHCVDANVVDGALFDDCVIDWALTQDADFVSAAAAQTDPAVEPNTRSIDQGGAVSENFDASVAPNFASPRYGAGAGTGTYAGPFGAHGRYVFYVPDLPTHSSATVTFDLITIGDWTTDASNNTASLTVNGTDAWTSAVATGTPSSTGTLPSGQPYAVYPVSVSVPHIDGQFHGAISAPIAVGSSRAFAVDNVQTSFSLVTPETYDVSLPVSVSNGVPSTGAGNLETIASEDDYRFTAPGGTLQLDLSDCGSSLDYYLDWQLINAQGDAVASGAGCGEGFAVPNVPAGQYRLAITHTEASGTYAMSLFAAPPPQTFSLTLPASVGDGTPAGAGNLETAASADVYAFATVADGNVQIDLSNCASSLDYNVDWALVNEAVGTTIYSTSGCGSKLVPNVPAGDYQLKVTRNGRSGTYALAISMQASPQFFNVSLPVSASNGAPEAGAGNLETTSSEDDYRFTTSSSGGIQVDVSNCSSSLSYYVNWSLIDDVAGTTLYSTSSCGSHLVTGVAAGTYLVKVSHGGSVGTYNLGILVQPPSQVFDIAPPASISNGVPAVGAGNLETTASEDDYRFTTMYTNDVQVNFSNCASSLGYNVDWKLTNSETGAVLYSTTGCGTRTVAGLPAGTYLVVVTRNGAVGTYNLGVTLVPAPDVFDVTLPVSVSNGVPAPGAGNLETTASQDDYIFSTTSAGAIQVDFSNCSSSLGYNVNWALVDTFTGGSVYSTTGCGSKLVTNVPAGRYSLNVSRSGASGTYRVGILVQPPAQVFNVSLPATISNGVPVTGAGNLETTASEDDYVFTTSTTGTLHVAFSTCASSLGSYVVWKLINDSSGSTVYSTSSCSTKTISALAAGPYRIIVTHNGASGTYALSVTLGP